MPKEGCHRLADFLGYNFKKLLQELISALRGYSSLLRG